MKINLEIEVRPFTVPNYVITIPKTGGRNEETPKIAIADLDAVTLEKMCNEFRASIFKQAGKKQ